MRYRRLLWIGFCLTVCAWTITVASRATAADDDVVKPIPLEKHKAGSFNLETPGVPADLYFTIAANYGSDATAEEAAQVKAGKLLWVAAAQTAKKGKGAKKNADKDNHSTSYLIQVPKNYDPNVPHGILVFVSAVPAAGLPAPYLPLLNKHHLIGVSAQDNGNNQDTIIRHARSVHAVLLLRERYTIDDDRIYITGVSGGGRLASQAMIINCDVFSGGLPMVGANACIPMLNAVSDGGKFEDPGVWRRPNPNLLKKAATTCRFAFLTTAGDFNRTNVQLVAEGYKGKGFKYVTYIEEAGAKHEVLSASEFDKGLDFLDAPILASAPKDFDVAKHPDQALLLFRKAVAHGGEADFIAEATTQANKLGKQYQEALAATEIAVRGDDAKAADFALAKLRKEWLAVCKADFDRLTTELKDARAKAKAKK